MIEENKWRKGQYTLEVADLKGRTFEKVYVNDDKTELVFEDAEYIFTFYHEQDCCECVEIEDITGDLEDLVGSPLLVAEESTSEKWDDRDSCTWTFYKFATHKGWVDVRWCGSSNGYYSESVDLRAEKKQ